MFNYPAQCRKEA